MEDLCLIAHCITIVRSTRHEACLSLVPGIVVTVTATGTATTVLFATIPPPPPRWRSVLVTVLLSNVSPLLLELLTVSRS